MGAKWFGQVAKGDRFQLRLAEDGGSTRCLTARIRKVFAVGNRGFEVESTRGERGVIGRDNVWAIVAINDRPIPQPVAVDAFGLPTDWRFWLTLRPFWDILSPGNKRLLRQGGALPRRAFVSDERKSPLPFADPANQLHVEVVTSPVKVIAGNVLIRPDQVDDVALDFILGVPRLSSVYVEIDRNNPARTLAKAHELVGPLRRHKKSLLYPVVIGPITDDLLYLTDDAYFESLRVSERPFDEYAKRRGHSGARHHR